MHNAAIFNQRRTG